MARSPTLVAPCRPVAADGAVGGIHCSEHAHDLRALGRPGDQRRVDERRDRRLEHRLVGRSARTSTASNARSTSSIDVVADLDPAAQQPRVAARGRELGQAVEHEVDLGHRARASGCCRPASASTARRVTGSTSVGQQPLRDRCPRRRAAPRAPRRPRARRRSTAPSRVVTGATRAPVRISAPGGPSAPPRAPRRRADGPPLANTVSPAAPPSLPAASASSTAVVPADHGPIAVYRTPRQAVRRRGSPRVANDSATKSATAIASTRRIVRPSSLAQAAERPPEPQARAARRRSPAP